MDDDRCFNAAATLASCKNGRWDKLSQVDESMAARSRAKNAKVRVISSDDAPRVQDSDRTLLSLSQVPNLKRVQNVTKRSPQSLHAEVRRQKNCDGMRRARDRQREAWKAMKRLVRKLEKQYAGLCVQASRASDAVTWSTSRSAQHCPRIGEVLKRLGAEHLYLKAELLHYATWKLHLDRTLESRAEMATLASATSGKDALQVSLAKAAPLLGFDPLTERDLTRIIVTNTQTMTRVQHHLLLARLSTKEWRTKRRQIFGWEIIQRVAGSVMECVFTKTFTGLNVTALMQKTWVNHMTLDHFQKIKCETTRLEVVQQLHSNAYVLSRDVMSPTDDIATFRSVFVRFQLETSTTLPAAINARTAPSLSDTSVTFVSPQVDPTAQAEMLEVTGYILGTQSVEMDTLQRQYQPDEKLAWAHLSLSIEFLDVVNPVTGHEYQQVRWTGRTDYTKEEHAHRNAGDTLQGLLRWELLTIKPALNLVSLALD